MPQVVLQPLTEEAGPAVPVFAKLVNRGLTKARTGTAVEESLIDTINAIGFGAVLVGFERRTEDRPVAKLQAERLDHLKQREAVRNRPVLPRQHEDEIHRPLRPWCLVMHNSRVIVV